MHVKRSTGLSFQALICGASLFVVAWPGSAASGENPYLAIVDRNTFGLKPEPPPPPPPAPEAVAPPPANTIKLTGITSVLSKPKALFEVSEPGNPEVHHPIMAAGDPGQYGIEVLAIDLVKGEVKIRNGSAETNVTFEAASLSAPPAPTPQMAPGRANMTAKTKSGRPITYPGAAAPPGSAAPGASSTVIGNARRGASNARSGVVVSGGGGDAMTSYTQGGANAPAIPNNANNLNNATINTRAIPPARNMRTPTQPNATPLSREQAIIQLELQRQVNDASNIPMPPLPPTPINPNPTGGDTGPVD